MLVLLWHSPYEYVVAGGFRRTQEILKRVPEGIEIVAIDSSPTMLGKSLSSDVIEYRFPASLRRMDRRFFVAMRLLEWLFAFVSLSSACVKIRMRKRTFDAIYVPSSEIFPAVLAGVVAKRLFNCRLVLCNTNIEFYPRLARRCLAALHNQSDLVITLSRDLEKSLRRNGVRAPIALNPAGLDLDIIKESLSGASDEKVYDAIFVGRHDQGKGILDLVEAWGLVTARRPNSLLVTAGIMTPEYRARLDRLIRKLGLEDRIVLSGVVDEQTKFRLMKESRVCVFPSYLEGWGIVPQEALACGLPVVVYDLPVYAENIKPCDAVRSVPLGDIEALAAATLQLIEAEGSCPANTEGPEFVKRFHWDGVASTEFNIIAGRWTARHRPGITPAVRRFFWRRRPVD